MTTALTGVAMAKTRFPAAVALFGWALCIAQGVAGQEPIDGVCDDSMRNGRVTEQIFTVAITDECPAWLCRSALSGWRSTLLQEDAAQSFEGQ